MRRHQILLLLLSTLAVGGVLLAGPQGVASLRGQVLGAAVETVPSHAGGLAGLVEETGVELIRLDDGVAPLQIVVVASLDCTHCIDFEAEGGLDQLVEDAGKSGRGIGYVHLGSTPGVLTVGTLEACLAEEGDSDGLGGRAEVARDYAFAATLRQKASEAGTSEALRAAITAEIGHIGASLGLDADEVEECLGQDGYRPSRQKLMEMTGITGTPSFLFERGDGQVGRITGFPGDAALWAAIGGM